MKQADRRIDWDQHNTAEILSRIYAADGIPGVLDEVAGIPVYLHNAHSEPELRGRPGDVLTTDSNGAICRATIDGAVWIGHLKAKVDGVVGIKLPATQVVGHRLQAGVARIESTERAMHPLKEIRLEIGDKIAVLYFDFHNGAMSTSQCSLLRDAFKLAAQSPVKIIVVMGGCDHWSNGIHLNQIEASDDPAHESWRNINSMNDLVHEIITTDKVVIAGLRGGAGAGGAILPLAADFVLCRDGVVLNPHYKNMGWLYGSEYWTYLLPRRIGCERAIELTENCLPLSASRAKQIGLVDEVMNKKMESPFGRR